VVYSTGLKGSGAQASIVGFTNLYTGCTTTPPTVNWAYNTANGLILTSPITSLDGTQIAFVQTSGSPTGIADLVLLKWAASGNATVTPLNVGNGAYRACTAPCMTTIRLRMDAANGNIAVDDRTSSVFYDYKNDVIWVGGALGWVHKFIDVFNGTPAADPTTVFPLQVANSPWTSSAVYDLVSNNVFVGDALGKVYAVNATTGAVIASGQLDFGAGIVDAPIIDQAAGLLYVFASSDGTTNCAGVACSAVYQMSTGFTSGTGTKVTVGNSLALGSNPNPNPMYIGGFDSSYYSSANRTGNLYVCGNTGAIPTLYQIPITAGAMPVSGLGTQFTRVGRTGSTAGCSPVTDIPNPNTTGGPSERLFLSVQNNGRPTACANTGCIISLIDTPWKPNTVYVAGQQILSPNLSIETVVTGGTSGASAPIWPSSAGTPTTDNGVVWIDQGRLFAATLPGWVANNAYASPTGRILDSNGNVEVSSTPGTSGASAPTWSTTPGGTTPDGPNTLVWKNAGPLEMFSMQSAGGTSGIIEDNVVSPSNQPGASQVYFGTLGNQTCGTGGSGGCAVQASQPALQ